MEAGESHVCVKEWMEASMDVDGSYRGDARKFIFHGLPLYLHVHASICKTSTRLPFDIHSTSKTSILEVDWKFWKSSGSFGIEWKSNGSRVEACPLSPSNEVDPVISTCLKLVHRIDSM